jgi:DNA recombination protein RmuC
MIVAYSLTLPYLLMLYQLHLQFARSVDMEHLQACLMEVDRQLDVLDGALENRLQRAVTMLGNTYQDGKQVTARIRAAVRGVQASGNGSAHRSRCAVPEPEELHIGPDVRFGG